jgi:hypothetical protein
VEGVDEVNEQGDAHEHGEAQQAFVPVAGVHESPENSDSSLARLHRLRHIRRHGKRAAAAA